MIGLWDCTGFRDIAPNNAELQHDENGDDKGVYVSRPRQA